MSLKQYKSNKSLQLVLSSINLSIFFAKIPIKINSNSEYKFALGFDGNDAVIMSIAMRSKVGFIEILEKYVEKEGISFLQNELAKANFIKELASVSEEEKCI